MLGIERINELLNMTGVEYQRLDFYYDLYRFENAYDIMTDIYDFFEIVFSGEDANLEFIRTALITANANNSFGIHEGDMVDIVVKYILQTGNYDLDFDVLPSSNELLTDIKTRVCKLIKLDDEEHMIDMFDFDNYDNTEQLVNEVYKTFYRIMDGSDECFINYKNSLIVSRDNHGDMDFSQDHRDGYSIVITIIDFIKRKYGDG